MNENHQINKVVVLGATGYVGGRLVPRLLDAGYHVRACGRSLNKLQSRSWAHRENIELIEANVLNKEDIKKAIHGCEAVFYLVHSMDPSNKDFVQADRTAAIHMREAAKEEGVKRIIYLGGLGEHVENLSKHLESRAEVGRLLREGDVPVTTFGAAMIIGSGSASFEILRYLVEHLPIMVTPKWVQTLNQPIAIRNVLEYLVQCLNVDETMGRSFDIGGPEVLTYETLMHTYAKVAGLKRRFIIPVPVLTPRLSSLWIHIVTPVPSYIARPLAEGLSNEVICQSEEIRQFIPQDLLSCEEAITRALTRTKDDEVKTYWADSGTIPDYATELEGDPSWAGGTLLKDERSVVIDAPIDHVWDVISRIGGKTGWYHADFLWSLRGWIDKMVGGVGLRRGRRDPVNLRPGDVLDFWRVVSVKENSKLLLVAEMRLPGRATLEFVLEDAGQGQTKVTQTARFRPKGLFGLLYWYAVAPLHHYVFGGMLKNIHIRSLHHV